MKTTGDYLDEFKRAMHWQRDSQIAKAWGVSRQLICQYRSGVAPLPDERIVEIVDRLGIESGVIYLTQSLERAQRLHNQSVIEAIARIARKAGLAALLAGATSLSPPPANAGQVTGDQTIHYTHPPKSRRQREREEKAARQAHFAFAQA